MEKTSRQEQRNVSQYQTRHSTGNISSPQDMPSSRKRADSHQTHMLTPLHARQSSDSRHQAVISAYLRSPYNDDDARSPNRLSSAEHQYTPSSAHHTQQGEIRRISGNFNAPTDIELERHKDHKKGARAMRKLKKAIRSLANA
ncbi:hypothetical protein CFE70_009911 [Pyrenophora teres f. teres 0-1]|uniref:Uncharacterized protein n=2 Tax=Pyrenophora teres f. teres TaxID=97479 RepID=E3RF37_PYRTT|nr:hypothetical protein PTT_05532 [Pyrenophora teres f. teres 0-1]KAE8826882.1 hypothetical protein HRS9139_08054 [Pyrenophora teres f. teres]KAE8836992.1 hypothetical protein HRS9122_07147 [Pyrenophora teres f. teres]KAE8856062.1 hypothetical protein PTNB29_08901 [Pyrenophora teres f. teres]KAE8860286.1 hypothetical protein PTNB73_07896 [Pyrenophora teres f. teres]